MGGKGLRKDLASAELLVFNLLRVGQVALKVEALFFRLTERMKFIVILLFRLFRFLWLWGSWDLRKKAGQFRGLFERLTLTHPSTSHSEPKKEFP